MEGKRAAVTGSNPAGKISMQYCKIWGGAKETSLKVKLFKLKINKDCPLPGTSSKYSKCQSIYFGLDITRICIVPGVARLPFSILSASCF